MKRSTSDNLVAAIALPLIIIYFFYPFIVYYLCVNNFEIAWKTMFTLGVMSFGILFTGPLIFVMLIIDIVRNH